MDFVDELMRRLIASDGFEAYKEFTERRIEMGELFHVIAPDGTPCPVVAEIAEQLQLTCGQQLSHEEMAQLVEASKEHIRRRLALLQPGVGGTH